MIIQFALQDFMIFLLCALGIAVAVLLIPILLNVKKVTGIMRVTLVENQVSIHKAFRSMPAILEDIGQVSHNGKEITNQLKISLPVIAKEVECAALAAKDGIESAGDVLEKIGSGVNSTVASYKDTSGSGADDATGFMAYVPLIKEVLQFISNAFLSKNRS